MSVDLFLGGPLGLWALDQVDAREIGNVYTRDFATFERARALNVPVYMDLDVADLGMRAIGLSFHYPRIFKSDVLDRYEYIYNIHPGLLPWGRCYYPVFWALWAGEPAGCTLHEIDEGIDSGAIMGYGGHAARASQCDGKGAIPRVLAAYRVRHTAGGQPAAARRVVSLQGRVLRAETCGGRSDYERR